MAATVGVNHALRDREAGGAGPLAVEGLLMLGGRRGSRGPGLRGCKGLVRPGPGLSRGVQRLFPGGLLTAASSRPRRGPERPPLDGMGTGPERSPRLLELSPASSPRCPVQRGPQGPGSCVGRRPPLLGAPGRGARPGQAPPAWRTQKPPGSLHLDAPVGGRVIRQGGRDASGPIPPRSWEGSRRDLGNSLGSGRLDAS